MSAGFKGKFWGPGAPGGGGGGVPDPHAPSHEPGGTDEIPQVAESELARTLPKEPNGIVDGENSVVAAFDNGTRTFSLTPTGAEFHYFANGRHYEKDAVADIILPDVEGLYYIYFDDGGDLKQTTTFQGDIIESWAIAAAIYWKPTLAKQIYWGREHKHGTKMDGRTHRYLHNNEGFRLETGGGLTDIVADGNGDLENSIVFGGQASECWDEDAFFAIAARLTSGNFPLYSREGLDANNSWTLKEDDEYPVVRAGGTGRAVWNENSGGTWGQAEVDNSDLVLAHIFLSNDEDRPWAGIMGQGEYDNPGAARDAAEAEINSIVLGGLVAAEFKFVGTLIIQTADAYDNGAKSRIRSTDDGSDYVDLRQENVLPGNAGTAHNSLPGLEGTGPEYNHLTDAQVADLHTHSNKAILDATTASFTSADETKLDGIEAGAEVNNISDVDATDLTDGGETTLHTHPGGGGGARTLIRRVEMMGQASSTIGQFTKVAGNQNNPSGNLAISTPSDQFVNGNIAPYVVPFNAKVKSIYIVCARAATGTGTVGTAPTFRVDIYSHTNTGRSLITEGTQRVPCISGVGDIGIWNNLGGTNGPIIFAMADPSPDVELTANSLVGFQFTNESGDEDRINAISRCIVLFEIEEVTP